MSPLLLIAVIFFAAGLIQGISGFGSALIAMPLLTLFIDVKKAVPLCILQSLLITSVLSVQLRPYMENRKILPLIAGSLPGIYLGATFLVNVESNVIKLLLGALIIAYSVYSLVYHPTPRKVPRVWAYGAGFCTGFIGSAFSAGGPPAIIYTSLTNWSKDHIKATLTGFFLASSAVTAVVHALSGITDALVVKYFLLSAGFTLAGVYAGSRVYGRISRQSYIKVILILLVLLGLVMTIPAVISLRG